MKPTDPMIEKIIAVSRDQLKETDCLLPTFFIGNGEGYGMVVAPFPDDEAKDLTAQAVAKIAAETGADYVIFVSESWTVEAEDAEDFMANRDKYPSVSDYPKRKDAVLFMIETKTSTLMGTAIIGADRTMSAVEWKTGEATTTGRFANFLGAKPVRH